MIPVPDNYEPYSDIRRVGLSLSFGVIAPDAAGTAVPASTVQSVVSDLAQTIDGIEEMSGSYTTLETNMWLLDGSQEFYPGGQIGWNSANMANAAGKFVILTWLSFTFLSPQSCYGFTLFFDNTQPENHPAEVITTTFDADGTQLETITTYPEGARHIINLPSQDFSSVRFTFTKSAIPARRVRVCEVLFGIRYDYDADTIKSVKVQQSVSPFAESLPSAEVEATVDNSDHLYNMVNPSGLYAYLQDGQFMDWVISVNGADIYMGKSYFTSAESEDGGLTASITFNDWIYALDDVKYTAERTESPISLQKIITQLLATVSDNLIAVFDGSLASARVFDAIPDGSSVRDGLRLCAQAAMCTCYIDRDNALHFTQPTLSDPVDEWGMDVQHDTAQVKIGQLYNVVELSGWKNGNGDTPIYRAENITQGDQERVYTATNPCVVPSLGNAVAGWLLGWVQRRISYDVTVRGNPALDLLDTVIIDDIYSVNSAAIITQLNYTFDGGLKCDGNAIR